MSTYTFTLAGDCGRTLKSLSELSYRRTELDRCSDYLMDLSGALFIHPAAVVEMLAVLQALSRTGKPIRLELPTSRKVQDYLSSIRFLDAVRTFADVEGHPAALDSISQDLNPILPVSRFETESDVDKIANMIGEAMTSARSGMAALLEPCVVIATELASNAVQHSESHGWILAQRYRYKAGPRIEIAVADGGIGIRASLRKNKAWWSYLPDDRAAVKLAVTERVSSLDDPHRGIGLQQVVERFAFPERRFTLWSGTGCLIVNETGGPRALARLPMLGVLAEARIPC